MKFWGTIYIMFSYFTKGVKDSTPKKAINFNELVDLIKNNPKKDIIEDIRKRKLSGDLTYKFLKESLPNITPNCVLKHKKLSNNNFNNNFSYFSNYLYFDIDNVSSEYKNHIISKYGDSVCLVSYSSGGGGLSILVRVLCTLTEDNFKSVWYHIRNTLFKDENIDEMCCNISRCWFIPYDEYVYTNESAAVKVDTNSMDNYQNAKQGKLSKNNINYIPNCTYKSIDIKIVLKKLNLQTSITVTNDVMDFNPEYVYKVYVPKTIPDSKKRITYYNLIHQLVCINPTIEAEYIFSYLNFVNSVHAKPSMPYYKLNELFNYVYNEIIQTGNIKAKPKLKKVHFNLDAKLPKETKISISNKINGLYRRKIKIDIINDAKVDLENDGKEITTRNISLYTDIKLRTVQLYFNCDRIDFENEVKKINMKFS